MDRVLLLLMLVSFLHWYAVTPLEGNSNPAIAFAYMCMHEKSACYSDKRDFGQRPMNERKQILLVTRNEVCIQPILVTSEQCPQFFSFLLQKKIHTHSV